jgi:hypothetical protein
MPLTAVFRITRKKLILCVHDLLKGHPFLLSRFCKLVPPELVRSNAHPSIVSHVASTACCVFAAAYLHWRTHHSLHHGSGIKMHVQGEEERQPRRVKRIEEKEEDRSKASLDREISIPIDLKSKGPARDTAQPPLGKRETKGAPKSALKRVATKCVRPSKHHGCTEAKPLC